MRIAVSGGGTGGHIYPALAVCEGLRRARPDCELLYFGSVTGMESEIVPGTGVPYQAVTAKKLRKAASLSTVGVVLSLVRGFTEARRHMRAFRAQAVVGTGGYVAAAALLAAMSLGIPTVLLAPDAVPGRTNRLLARFARWICLVFEESAICFPAGRTVVTGLPLRAGVIAPRDLGPAEARCSLANLRADRFTLLVIGGSQGARRLNEVVIQALPDLIRSGSQVLHQTGSRNLEDVKASVAALGLPENAPYSAVAFLNDRQVPLAYRAADVILCRGGISTLSEAMANRLPAIVVPLPTAYADHQTANGAALARSGAALLCPERELDAVKLVQLLDELRANPSRLAELARASQAVSKPFAADTVAGLILGL